LAEADRSIIVRACKYDGREHRRWSAELLRQEGPLVVLDAHFSEEVVHSHLGTVARGTHSLEYYWLDRWYNIFRFAQLDGSLRNYYCNVNLPPTLENGVLSYVDLDLDILVNPDLSYQVLDYDDFETHSKLYSYSDELRTNANRAVEDLIHLIEARQFPFDDR
jgi:uncharacterized protein